MQNKRKRMGDKTSKVLPMKSRKIHSLYKPIYIYTLTQQQSFEQAKTLKATILLGGEEVTLNF